MAKKARGGGRGAAKPGPKKAAKQKGPDGSPLPDKGKNKPPKKRAKRGDRRAKGGGKASAKAGVKTGSNAPPPSAPAAAAAAAAQGASDAVISTLAPPLRMLARPTGEVLDRLHAVVLSRKEADPAISHSARLLARGQSKVAQKFGEEAVECLIEAVLGNKEALVGESADVLYHLLVLWVSAGVEPAEVWAELQRREGMSGLIEKASRAKTLPSRLGLGTTKIP